MGLFDFLFKKEPKVSKIDILRSRLEEVFALEYSDYELRKDIHITEIKYTDEDISYSYGLYSGAMPKALIMAIDNRNDYRTKAFRTAKSIAEDDGIVYLNFFSHLPNEMEYISGRLRDNIR